MNYWEREQAESIQRWKDSKVKHFRRPKPKPVPREGRVCPECHLRMPVAGGCQNC